MDRTCRVRGADRGASSGTKAVTAASHAHHRELYSPLASLWMAILDTLKWVSLKRVSLKRVSQTDQTPCSTNDVDTPVCALPGGTPIQPTWINDTSLRGI
jgi:hypothetical protein